MFYYNITFSIEKEVFEAFQKWIFEKYISEWIDNQWFEQATFLKVLLEQSDSFTYCVQLKTSEKNKIKQFQLQKEMAFRHQMFLKFGQKVLLFATELQEIAVFNRK